MLALDKILLPLMIEVISSSHGDAGQKYLRCFLFPGMGITSIEIISTSEQLRACNYFKFTTQIPITSILAIATSNWVKKAVGHFVGFCE